MLRSLSCHRCVTYSTLNAHPRKGADFSDVCRMDDQEAATPQTVCALTAYLTLPLSLTASSASAHITFDKSDSINHSLCVCNLMPFPKNAFGVADNCNLVMRMLLCLSRQTNLCKWSCWLTTMYFVAAFGDAVDWHCWIKIFYSSISHRGKWSIRSSLLWFSSL